MLLPLCAVFNNCAGQFPVGAAVHSQPLMIQIMKLSSFCNSRYITFQTQHPFFQNSHNEFITLSLNVQSIDAKFNQLYPIVSNLSSMGLYFGAICLQHLMPIYHCLSYLATTSSTRALNAPNTLGS